MDYSVRATFAGEGIDQDLLPDLAEQLEPESASVSFGTFGFGITMTCARGDTDRIDQVISSALDRMASAVKEVGLPDLPIVEASATEWSLFEKQLEEPTFPNVVGVSELAEMLGVSRQRASELARSPGFPAPFTMLAAGPVWIEPNVSDYIKTWVRKPGRPPGGKHLLGDGDRKMLDDMGRANRHWHREDMSAETNDLGSPG